jgi:hypothetical protein
VPCRHQRIDEAAPLSLVAAQREQLLELTDRDHQPTAGATGRALKAAGIGAHIISAHPGCVAVRSADDARKLVKGMLTRRQQRDMRAGAVRCLDSRQQPRAHQRRLPAPRRTDDRHEAGVGQACQHRVDLRLAAVEQRRVVMFERAQPLVRAHNVTEVLIDGRVWRRLKPLDACALALRTKRPPWQAEESSYCSTTSTPGNLRPLS